MIDFSHKAAKFKTKALARLCGTITHVRTSRPVIALTFDDGPDPVETPKILDLLERHGAKATFFVLGIRAAQHPKLIQRMAQSGHALGNHGWSHASMPTLSSRLRRQEIMKTHKVLKPYGTRLFRPPFGHYDWPTCLDLARCGCRSVAWNVAARDWLDRTDQQIMTLLEDKLKPGSIVLLHDSLYTFERVEYRSRKPLLSALDQLIGKLRTQYSFVTIPELLQTGRSNKVCRFQRGDQTWLESQLRIEDSDTSL